MDGVSVAAVLGRIDLELAAAISTEVVHVGSISPHGVDRRVAVVGTLNSQYSDQHNLSNNTISRSSTKIKLTTPELEPTGASKLSPRWVETLALVMWAAPGQTRSIFCSFGKLARKRVQE